MLAGERRDLDELFMSDPKPFRSSVEQECGALLQITGQPSRKIAMRFSEHAREQLS